MKILYLQTLLLQHYFIECPDDNVAEGWWFNEATDTLHEEKVWTKDEARIKRDEDLGFTDFMLLEDSKYVTDPANAALLANIKTYRQALRDLTTNDPILDSSWPQHPIQPTD